jgi:site-specific recombinase XerD
MDGHIGPKNDFLTGARRVAPKRRKGVSMQESETKAVVVAGNNRALATADLPALVAAAGDAAAFCWEEFFSGQVRNPNTRKAYVFAVRRFLGWCELHDLQLPRITPGMVGRYFNEHSGSIPSKKLHMAAIRGFFDVLVRRHVVVLNPALSVRTERYSAVEGRTAEITVEQARRLLASVNGQRAVDFRDRAILGVLIYTAGRAGAVARLRLRDFVDEGSQYALRFAEKGGKARSIPVRYDLQQNLLDYLLAAGLLEAPKDAPLFRTALGKLGRLSDAAMTGIDICRMVKRRLAAADLPTLISPHSFRSCAATDLLLQGVPLEDVQYLLGHADARTTRLYDRRRKQVTRNIVERISV